MHRTPRPRFRLAAGACGPSLRSFVGGFGTVGPAVSRGSDLLTVPLAPTPAGMTPAFSTARRCSACARSQYSCLAGSFAAAIE